MQQPNSRLNVLQEHELLGVEKPGQYLGKERNAVYKHLATVDARIALAFPDAYEVGMSHVGLQILYDLINRDPAAWAERVYTPLPDMEALMRERNAPLTSLESGTPLAAFDVVGFSLQYELCGTNILAMLDLAGIPLLSKDRNEQHPLIIAGGPFSYHPEPLAPFIDVFLLGDAEEFIPELLSAVRSTKRSAGDRRRALLDALRTMEGIYIPDDFIPEYSPEGEFLGVLPKYPERPVIERRLLPTMEGAPYPKRPVVPNVKTIHNRLSVEVMRGCVRGCRFCQAGYLYRPQRERSPEEVMEMIESVLPETGFEEVSLLSLSTADYCSIVPLLKSLMDKYGDGDKLAISFPSTRVDSLKPEVLEQVQRVRRTGFTVAPEGGTQRLRDVINKGVSDEQILETCSNVFRMGWSGIKLYFMLGLPTETDEDLEGIVDIARRVRGLPEARGKDITVSVSTLVPKPHTPFQWAGQISPEETIRRQRVLAQGLRRARVNFRYHDHFSSFLEGVFCRGGREIAAVILRAYELGCRLDAWKEHIDEERWMQAFSDCDINPYHYLRERDVEEPLPWDHLSCGISKDYFQKEYKRALKDRATPDCLTKSCSICGACNYDDRKNILWPRHETELISLGTVRLDNEEPLSTPQQISEAEPVQRLRVRYQRLGSFRILGHLEVSTIFHRSARRAAIPVCFSQGFHPMPRIAFGPPLPLGVQSESDFFDIYLTTEWEPSRLIEQFNRELPKELQLIEAEEIPVYGSSLQELLRGMRYRLDWLKEPEGILGAGLAEGGITPESLTELLLSVEVSRAAKGAKKGRRAKKERRFQLENYVYDLSFENGLQSKAPAILFSLRIDPTRACPNPVEIAGAWSDLSLSDYELKKLATYFASEEPKTSEPKELSAAAC